MYQTISLMPGTPLIDLPQGKGLEIDTVPQNRLNAIKNGSKVLGVTSVGYPLRQKFRSDLKSVLWFKSYSFFSTKLVLKF